jgi:hypothetical protein
MLRQPGPGPGRQLVRFREDTEEHQARAREAIRAWRDENPGGSTSEMLAALRPGFHKDYEPVLRAILFRADLRDAKVTTGITIIAGEAGR